MWRVHNKLFVAGYTAFTALSSAFDSSNIIMSGPLDPEQKSNKYVVLLHTVHISQAIDVTVYYFTHSWLAVNIIERVSALSNLHT